MLDIVSWPVLFRVHPRKITDYLLDPASDDGRSKCADLESYGFARGDPATLTQALLRHARIERFVGAKVSSWGLKFLFDGPLAAPNRRDANLLTVWQVKAGVEGNADFLTSRPSRRRVSPTDLMG